MLVTYILNLYNKFMNKKIILALLLDLTLLVTILFVSGCGQSGPLYLPAHPAKQPPPLPPSPMVENNHVPVS